MGKKIVPPTTPAPASIDKSKKSAKRGEPWGGDVSVPVHLNCQVRLRFGEEES
ncbi:MAG: hypothetical protein MUC60_19400 [Oscillatoria sp. Prado101]|nr:hypothetical protein [Oscillatoria sp. Prado101]